MESDSRWQAARRISGGDWQDIHVAPVSRELCMEIVDRLRSGEMPELNSSPLQWSSEEDGSWGARDSSYEYRIADIDRLMQRNG